MPLETEDRLDLSCLVSSLAATIVTKCGIVYQGTVLDWNCGGFRNPSSESCPSDSSDSPEDPSSGSRRENEKSPHFIRLELACLPGTICCSPTPNDPTAANRVARVSTIIGSNEDTDTTPLYDIGTTVLVNWDDVSSIGSIGVTPTCLTVDLTP